MLYTIIDISDIFYRYDVRKERCRSSNPFDYVRSGYYLENAALFGGENDVSYNCDISSHITGGIIYNPRKPKRTRGNLS